MSDREFRAFSGADAKIQGDRGGAFTLFDGLVIGCNVELTPESADRPSFGGLSNGPPVFTPSCGSI